MGTNKHLVLNLSSPVQYKSMLYLFGYDIHAIMGLLKRSFLAKGSPHPREATRIQNVSHPSNEALPCRRAWAYLFPPIIRLNQAGWAQGQQVQKHYFCFPDQVFCHFLSTCRQDEIPCEILTS